jgi:glutaredoxin
MKKQATVYRMVTDEHICPFGIKSKQLLEREGYVVEDHHLTSREQTDRFKAKNGVETTPQTFIDGTRIGGHDELLVYLGKTTKAEQEEDGTTYQPVIAVFATTAMMAIASVYYNGESFFSMKTLEWFVAFSMCVLAILKLSDLSSFSNQFLGYDLLAQKDMRYAYFYPFAEAAVGILMISGTLTFVSAPLALFIGTAGTISVIKAVYIDKRDLKCACVGGDSNVPLGAISLTENLMMVAMGGWMLIGLAVS